MFRQATRRAILALMFILIASPVLAAPYAAMVMDARTGEVVHARNADTRLHPASLTKMMTLYVTFDAIRRGEISLSKKVKISARAAKEQPSKLGLKAGQRISVRYLIRAAAVKSANDAATALAEAVSGSVPNFARRMTRTAKALGMTRTTFKNANGLTQSGHLSTARDMTKLGRRLFYDFPDYYNLFSRKSTDAGVRTVVNTNRKLLGSYRGADGIKTGYTSAAGFNLVASARRGNQRVIATVFGGKTSATRNKRVAQLLDMGFNRTPRRVTVRKPAPVDTGGGAKRIVVAKTIVLKSPRPKPRMKMKPALVAGEVRGIEIAMANNDGAVSRTAVLAPKIIQPAKRPVDKAPDKPRVVTRVSTSGGRHWAVVLGTFGTRHQAEKILLKTALRDLQALDGALRKIDPTSVKGRTVYRARFVNMTQADANKACARLGVRNEKCTPVRADG